MIETKIDPVFAAVQKLRRVLGRDPQANAHWLDAIHERIGQLSDAIKEQVHSTEHVKAEMGQINPDFQHAPGTERHDDCVREQLIQLNERLHQLRADLRNAKSTQTQDLFELRSRIEELVEEIEHVRKEDDKFILDTVNSNPGAGD